jgi:SAM-dependent methyltransferase
VQRLLEATARAEANHFWFKGLRRFVAPLVAEAVAGIPSPRLLDCGCGTGANLQMLGRFGTAVGFDLTAGGLVHGRKAGRSGLARASVTQVPFPDAAFDVVTSFDVLYCLEEEHEVKALAEMYRVLKPGGAAIVNVAAMSILRGTHSVLSHEVRRYDRPRLRSALERAGFRIVRLTYTNATLFPMVLAVRLLQRAAGPDTSRDAARDMSIPPAPFNALFDLLLRLEAALIGKVSMPFGSSLLCLARKAGPAG